MYISLNVCMCIIEAVQHDQAAAGSLSSTFPASAPPFPRLLMQTGRIFDFCFNKRIAFFRGFFKYHSIDDVAV